MKKLFLIPVLLLGVLVNPTKSDAQVLDDVYVKEHVPSRKPVPYKFLREADAMYKKRVWRVIDLREKMNLNLYYPTTPIDEARMSLIDLLLWGLNNEGLTVYNTDDDRFTQPILRAQVESNFGAGEENVSYIDENGDEQIQTVSKGITSSEVKQYWLKEDWFFDRQHSVMDVRIIGISPIRFYIKDGGDEEAEPRKSRVFWAYFPEIRRILANHEVFNNNNDAERRTYDDIFFKRYFSSFIVKVSNVYDDRAISDYSMGIQSLLESERIKNEMNDFEQDLWEY